MTAIRERLPHRRRAVAETIEFIKPDGSVATYDAAVGYDDDLRPKEIFLSGAREGSEMGALLADVAVIISVALQHGVPAAALASSLARVPVDVCRTMPASLIGAAVGLLLAEDRLREAVDRPDSDLDDKDRR